MLKKYFQSVRDRLFSTYERQKLKSSNFIIVANNCWGYELYSATGREYNTPFVGLFLMTECYIRLLENFDECINAELKFTQKSKYGDSEKHYPVGLLPHDIEIHFLHYSSQEEALIKWNRRIRRLKDAIEKGAELYIKLCDSEGWTLEQISKFHKLPFRNKISLGVKEFESDAHVYVPNMRQPSGRIFDGAKLYKKRYRYFDITIWILEGRIAHSPISRFFALFP